MYGRLARLYDLVYADKPYGSEARAVRAVALRYLQRPARTLLDVACGTGRHLEQFARWFDCAGVDASSSMLIQARQRVPAARFSLGRMESFDLGREFDIVTCLFSAIAYARSSRELTHAIQNFARHTAPGGVVVVEPFVAPERFRAGRIGHRLVRSKGVTILRMDTSRRRGNRSVFDFHYLIGTPGRVEHVEDVQHLALSDRRMMERAFRGAGLRVRYLRGGLSAHRGLYVGLRPRSAVAVEGPRATAGRSRPRAAR